MKRETRLSHKGTHYFDVTNGAGTPAPTLTVTVQVTANVVLETVPQPPPID